MSETLWSETHGVTPGDLVIHIDKKGQFHEIFVERIFRDEALGDETIEGLSAWGEAARVSPGPGMHTIITKKLAEQARESVESYLRPSLPEGLVTCEHCGGRGMVYGRPGMAHPVGDRCKKCGGSGNSLIPGIEGLLSGEVDTSGIA